MKTYTASRDGVRRGIKPVPWEDYFSLGGGVKSVDVHLFRKNPPEQDSGGYVHDAYPLRRRSGEVVLAKDAVLDRQGILVFVRTRTGFGDGTGRLHRGWYRVRQNHSNERPIGLSGAVIVSASGPKDYYKWPQDNLKNLGWRDALVVLLPGDMVKYRCQDGTRIALEYVSPEEGIRVL